MFPFHCYKVKERKKNQHPLLRQSQKYEINFYLQRNQKETFMKYKDFQQVDLLLFQHYFKNLFPIFFIPQDKFPSTGNE